MLKLTSLLADQALTRMNILNEIVTQHPGAISFGPGRPPENLFGVQSHIGSVDDYLGRGGAGLGDGGSRWDALGQYGPTNGIINELVAEQLRHDEGIDVSPAAIMITAGAQEAMAILLIGLFDRTKDVLLVSDPTYLGITGLARVLGLRVVPVQSDDWGLDPFAVEEALATVASEGRNARALYDIPDFNNPRGTQLSLQRRHELLEICMRQDLWLIEDNPYGMFHYDGPIVPTLKALDRNRSVIYVGTFSKTLFPGLRIGYLVADQEVVGAAVPLAKELSRVKSFLSVNTSPISQAIVAGALLRSGGTLEPIVRPKRERLKRNRDLLVEELGRAFSPMSGRVRWNTPEGGFFITVSLPFEFGSDEAEACAADYGVVVMPMQFFSVSGRMSQGVRLSFSSIDSPVIGEGVDRFASFVSAHCRRS